jgi:predicted RNA-binding protein YlxR (DUF448 family)
VRRCIATGAQAPRGRLVRLALAPNGTLTPDVAARLPGRGAWLTPSRAAIDRAVKRKLFAKAFGGAVRVPENLADAIELLLVGRMVDTLGLARRAGQAVAGSAKVEDWIARGRPGLLVLARDAGADAQRRWQTLPDGVARVAVLDGAEIGRAFARERSAQAAVAEGELMRRLVDDAARLAGLRPAGPRPGDETTRRDSE